MERRLPQPWTWDNYLGELERPFTVAQGLFAANQLVGSVWAWLLPPEAHLLRINVAENYEGQGLGTILLATLAKIARAKDCAKILLEVSVTNQRALSLYRRAGFLIDGRAKNYYSGQEDAWRMSLELADGLALD
jgi:ribosomal-protein-alanine N-acetyltransferase